jgi:hypothetical protein
MKVETLHAIDALYLENYLQTLLYKACHAESELREHLRQAEVLSATEGLSSNCRSRYENVAKRLAPLVAELEEIMGDLYVGGKLASDSEPLIQWGLVETIPEHETSAVIERLNLAERTVISALNHIGCRLASMPDAKVFWAAHARVRTYLKLKSIPDRPCYQDKSMVRFCASPPYQTASYFAKLSETDAGNSDSPWILDSEFIPLTALPLFEDLEIELDIHGNVTMPSLIFRSSMSG